PASADSHPHPLREGDETMKIVIPGGSGHVGTILARAFFNDGHEVIVLSRNHKAVPWKTVHWDGQSLGPWVEELRVRYGLGGQAGNGRQFVSWIHEQDFMQAIYWLIGNDVQGAVNIASPIPLPNRDFMRALRSVWGVPFGLPASRSMLELAAAFMRTETELVLKSRRVVPGVLLKRGFDFRFRF